MQNLKYLLIGLFQCDYPIITLAEPNRKMAGIMDQKFSFWENGPAPGAFYNFPHQNKADTNNGTQHTM